MIQCYGVHDIVTKEIVNLATFNELSEEETYGIIVGYRCLDSPLPECTRHEKSNEDNIVFIPELIKNSGATVSLLNVLSNLGLKKINFLQGLLDSPTQVDYMTLGQALVRMPDFKRIHDTSQVTATMVKSLKYKLDEDNEPKDKEPKKDKVYHYISYIYVNGYIWKLDGRREKPIKLQRVRPTERWLEILRDAVRDQIELNDMSASVLALVTASDASTFAGRTVNKVMRYIFNR
ncbi:cysteine proteinase [Backusella circina FSU 941]|nr:cysteine proteinase [Backusella circina FSU 941]